MNSKISLLAMTLASVMGLGVVANANAANETDALAKAIAKQEAEIAALKQQLNLLTEQQKSQSAQQQVERDALMSKVETVASEVSTAQDRYSRFSFKSYGTANYTSDEYFDNVQDTSPERRNRFDLERIVTEFGYQFTDEWSMEVEIEYEHGGTGTSLEYDGFDEFGEFESEVEVDEDDFDADDYFNTASDGEIEVKSNHPLVSKILSILKKSNTKYYDQNKKLIQCDELATLIKTKDDYVLFICELETP